MSKIIFGIDIGGTSVKLGLFDERGILLDKWEIKTDRSDNGKNIIPDILNSIKSKMLEKNIAKEDIEGIGFGVPGPVSKEGIVFKCANLGWSNVNVRKEVEKYFNVNVGVGNDATVATLGEMWQGGGNGYKNIVMVTLGTGVGGGIVINGDILYGTTGSGGEIGHIHVNDDEEESCGCGNKGCLEQYASATGIVRLAKKYLSSNKTETKLSLFVNLSAKDIFDCAKENDIAALEIVEEYNKYLGTALANIAAIVDPEVFVIGGGVSRAGDIIISGVKKYYNKVAFPACKNAKFSIAKLGNDAGIYGAAKLIIK